MPTHGNIVQTVEVWQSLNVSFVFYQLLGSSVEKTDVLWVKSTHMSPKSRGTLTGSARRISSPLSSKISRSTPCAAGCWGLVQTRISRGTEKGFSKAAHPKLTGRVWSVYELSDGDLKYLTGKMPHLRIFPRSRLCQNLTRRNSLQVFSYMLSVCALSAMRGGCRILRYGLSERWRGAR